MSGIYIHIPFCVRKCVYCDFYSETNISVEDDFTESLIKEIGLTSSGDKQKIDTVYFGGGTPSAISAGNIKRILDGVTGYYDVQKNAEITIEVNPGTMSINKLEEYKKTGINRLNIGVQSFNDENLKFLGRIHSAEEAHLFIEQAKKTGFDNIGIDLIYGIPGQSVDTWLEDLKTAVKIKPKHLSCYSLTYEEGTPLYRLYEDGSITPADETLSAALFDKTISFLESNGFIHYEISNFATSLKTRSRHNMKYWDFVSYSGFGPSAHSFDAGNGKRSWNISNVYQYMEHLKENCLPVEEEEYLSKEQKMTEAVFLGLRKTDGIDFKTFQRAFNINFKDMFKGLIENLTSSELIIITDHSCRLSKKGLLLADNIALQFVSII